MFPIGSNCSATLLKNWVSIRNSETTVACDLLEGENAAEIMP